MFLRQSTSKTVRFGPFLDSTDGVSPEAGLTIANTDIDLSKAGGAFGSKNSGGATADGANGWYSMTLDTTDTNTVGELIAECTVSGALPVWFRWRVLEEAVYDALFAASAAGPLQSTTAGRKLDVNAAGEAGLDLDNTSGTLDTAQFGSDHYDSIALTRPDRHWFVSKAGNDGNSGKTWATAFLTIGAARAAASDDDWITVGDGSYSEQIDFTAATALQGITLELLPKAIITSGTAPTITLNNHCRIIGGGTVGHSGSGYAISASAVDAISFHNIRVTSGGQGILLNIDATTRCLIEDVVVSAEAAGLDLIGLGVPMLYVLRNVSVRCTGKTGASPMAAIYLTTCSAVFDGVLIEMPSATSNTSTAGVNVTTSQVAIVNTHISVTDALGIETRGITTDGNALTKVSVLSGSIRTTGTGNVYDLVNSGSAVLHVSAGLSYDTAKTSGTITDLGNSILTDTTEIGTAGAGLTDLGGMSTGMKAEVNAEADTALSDWGKTGFSLLSSGLNLVTAWTVDITGDLSGSVGSVTAAVTTDAASRTASKADVSALATTGADSDTLETLSDQLDGLSALSGEGAYTGTLTIDDGSTGLEGATVNARRGGVLKASGTTNASGQITNWVFGAFTYDLAVRLSGYQPDTDTITVTADAWTKTISLTAISITAPSDATLCTVQFRVKLSATAVSGAVCKAKLDGVNHASDGTVLSNQESSVTTDAQGVGELELVQQGSLTKGKGIYDIRVEIDGKPVASLKTAIPNQSTILFEDLLK